MNVDLAQRDVAEVMLADLEADVDGRITIAEVVDFAHLRWGWPGHDPLCPPPEVTLRALLLWERIKAGEVPRERVREPQSPTPTAELLADAYRDMGCVVTDVDGASFTITFEDS